MLKHAEIWAAIDRLAQDKGLSPSGLARSAGLDPTTFNRSKRITREGKARWPSTESISKILSATETSLSTFVGLVNGGKEAVIKRTIKLTSLAKLGTPGPSEGNGKDEGWDEMLLPRIEDPLAFAVEVGGSGYEPVYRDGDILIVSPGSAPRRGDRILILPSSGPVLLGILQRRTATRMDFRALDKSDESSIALDEIRSIGRILWASQ